MSDEMQLSEGSRLYDEALQLCRTSSDSVLLIGKVSDTLERLICKASNKHISTVDNQPDTILILSIMPKDVPNHYKHIILINEDTVKGIIHRCV